jgi:cardiolipin synthase A/B
MCKPTPRHGRKSIVRWFTHDTIAPPMRDLLHVGAVSWEWFSWITLALAVLSIPSVLVRRRGRPAAALAWILCLVSLPPLGILLWWMLGRSHLERRRRRRRHASATIAQRLQTLRGKLDEKQGDSSRLVTFTNLPQDLAYGVFKPTSGNRVRLLVGGEAFTQMEKDIRGARHHVHVLFYIWKDDSTGRRFRDLLIKKARAGVEVRVLCDAVGSPVIGTRFSRRLRRAGARVARFLPPSLLAAPRLNFRNHRKILVIDGRVGVIGGFNIADEYRTRWRDMGVRLEGPAVDQMQEVFAEDWYYATGEALADTTYFGRWDVADHDGARVALVASGPDMYSSPIHDALFVAMNGTKERLWIMTPYFIPSASLLSSLRVARYRGVDVRIMVPGVSDVPLVRWAARSYYPELLEVGVRIFEYLPSMMHAKVTIFDRELILIGSANIDNRSFRLNFEASAFVAGRKLNEEIAAVFEGDLDQCREVKLADLEKQGWPMRLVDATAHLLSPLL